MKLTHLLVALLIANTSFSQVSLLKDAIAKKKEAARKKKVQGVESALTFKTLTVNGKEIKCQRTTSKQRSILCPDITLRKELSELENTLENYYQIISTGGFLDQKPGYKISSTISRIQRAYPNVTVTHYQAEYNAYEAHVDAQKNDPNYHFYVSKKELSDNKYHRAEESLQKCLALDPDHKQAKDLLAEVSLKIYDTEIREHLAKNELNKADKKVVALFKSHMDQASYPPVLGELSFAVAKQYLETAKSKWKEEKWENGYYFYVSLRHFANAYSVNYKKQEVIQSVKEINTIGKASGKHYTAFPEEKLHMISSNYQIQNLRNIDALKAEIKENKSKEDKEVLYNNYSRLVELETYRFDYGYWNDSYYWGARKQKAILEIEVGDNAKGCEDLYNIDASYYYNYGFSIKSCKEWDEIRAKKDAEEHQKELAIEVIEWRKTNPSTIKLRSLLSEGTTEVEAYLGKPIANNYKVSVGTGLADSYQGKKYKTKDGVYEVGYKNNNVMLINFYPAKYIKYDPDVLGDEENSGFDLEVKGSCFGSFDKGHIGGINTFTMSWDCTNHLASTTYYGQNGKLLSVTVY